MNPSRSRRSLVSGLSFRPVTFVPSISTSPEVGRSSAAMQCIRVDLPDPDGPMIAVIRPRSKSTETPASAFTAVDS